MKVWITQRCLTIGIISGDGVQRGSMWSVKVPGSNFEDMFEARFVFETPEFAAANARIQRDARIAALTKTIERYRRLEF